MDWQKLFLSAYGRSKRQDFWIGWLILFGAEFILSFVPLINILARLFGVYVRVCLYSKRLHDMGRSGWWQILPWVVNIVGAGVGLAIFGSGIIAAAINYERNGQNNDPAAILTLLGAMGGMLGVLGILSLVGMGFLIWVGSVEGQKGENQYGPDPLTGPETDVF